MSGIGVTVVGVAITSAVAVGIASVAGGGELTELAPVEQPPVSRAPSPIQIILFKVDSTVMF